ncbi:MAG TPA: hypothetical protein VGQ51_14060 [Puia sp.]|jgi:hypothetical protein|nr:hypothetical protein [Puia sp.]
MTRSINQLSHTLLKGSKIAAFIAALLLTVGISSSFATPNNDRTDAVTASFRKDFKKAELLATESGKNFTKLTFKMNDVVLFAFYSGDGNLLAVVRNIKLSQLPIQLMLKVKQDYSDYWISDLFELDADGSTNYYITLENANSTITLRSADTTTWETYSKKTKE